MKEARFKYYKGLLTSQYEVADVKDQHGIRFGNIVLHPRIYLANPKEVSEEEYEKAVAARLSEDSLVWQQRFMQPGEGIEKPSESNQSGFIKRDNPYRIHPHILQKGETLVEFEPTGENPFAEVVGEIYAEFAEGDADSPYKGWQFIAQKDGKYHGRISGNAFCKVLELDPEDKKARMEVISRRENITGNRGLTKLLPSKGFRLISLFTGSGCLQGGCAQMGCGLLTLLFLLAALLGLWKSCSSEKQNAMSPRVIHDTVYLKEGRQVKELDDSTRREKTNTILLPYVQFYPNSSTLLPYSIRPIQELAEYMTSHTYVHAVIKGYTDDVGEATANLKLSQDRAEAVRNVLVSLGINRDRIEAYGYGESKPKVQGQTIEARSLNRRVEVELRDEEIEKSGNMKKEP